MIGAAEQSSLEEKSDIQHHPCSVTRCGDISPFGLLFTHYGKKIEQLSMLWVKYQLSNFAKFCVNLGKILTKQSGRTVSGQPSRGSPPELRAAVEAVDEARSFAGISYREARNPGRGGRQGSRQTEARSEDCRRAVGRFGSIGRCRPLPGSLQAICQTLTSFFIL